MSRLDYPWARRRRRTVTLGSLELEVLEQERSIGKRSQTHTYPYVDLPYTEEIGRAPRTYRLDAIVLGDDYDVETDRILETLERRGRLRLRLWTGEPVWVLLQNAGVAERSSEQGFAIIAINLVEAGQASNPTSSIAGRSRIDRALASVLTAATSAFPAVASNVATIASLGDRMLDLAGQLSGELSQAMDTIDENAGGATDAATALSDFDSRLGSLATDAFGMAISVSDLFDELSQIPGDAFGKFEAFRHLVGWGEEQPPVSTATFTGQLAADNQAALGDLVARLAAAHLAVVTTRMQFESAQEAAEHRQDLADVLDAVMLRAADAGDIEVYNELRTAKAIAVSDLDSRAARLPVRVDLVLGQDLPSIVLAWRLYADPTRGPELARRNQIRHPAFVPGGTPLEVLSPVAGA